uniref:hypothetical protein n=1 Tax=Algoriphagus sp. TaxID=1872435 RepID=UPI0025885898|nr:hypothetical protein [Algoriphagus sp.]
MRKSAAIILLSCFGLYQFGFFAVQFLMPLAIHQQWNNQIWDMNEDFLEGKLIRIPFSIPYGQNQENFQSVNFSMEIEGKMNRVIKQRYFEDHLEVVVVEDELQSKLDEQVKLWIFSLSTDQGDFDGPPLQKVLLKSFVKDFIPQALGFSFSPNLTGIQIRHSFPFLFSIPLGTKDIILLPPQQIQLS